MKKMRKPASKNIEDIIALTPMQQGMLFLYLKDPKSDKNFEQLYLEISGKIDIALVRKAWDFVIHTDEMLRTVFRWEKTKAPVQIILKQHHLNLEYFDFSSKNRDEKKILLKEIKDKDRDEQFDLHQVAFRVTLCKIEEEKYGMLISNHHILYDGWSNGIIIKEFFNAYNDLRHNRVPVKPVKGRFKDFIHWMQSQDTDDIKKKQEKFWKDYLEGFEVRGRRPQPIHGQPDVVLSEAASQKFVEKKRFHKVKRKEEVRSTGEYRFRFQAETKRNIENFVKKHKISLSSLVYLAWGLLLQGYYESEDILFDTTVSGRSARIENMENMVGLFINTLPLRVKTHPEEKIIDALQRISRIVREREEFENTSPLFIKDYLCRYRDDVLFDSLVVIENYPLEIKSIEETNEFSFGSFSSIGTANYDLTVILTIFDHIEVNFIFNNQLLSQAVVEEMSHLFTSLIKNIIENPVKRVTEFRISPERVQLTKANQKFLRGESRCFTGAVFSKSAPPGRRRRVEWELIKIWSDVFARDAGSFSIGIDDNFFDLGGHSLSASLLTAAVHKVFNVKLPLGELFKLRTIRNIANYIMKMKKDRFVPILPVEKKEFYPLSSAQKRIYILQRMDPDSVVYNGSLVVVIEGRLNKNRLTQSFRDLMNRHESLRTSFEWLEGEPVQRIHEKVEFNILHFQVKRCTGPEQGQNQGIPDNVRPIIMGFRKSFDLDKAPLFKVGLVEIEAHKQVLMVDIHHIISDGISRDILVKEFMALYLNLDLPRLQLQYRDFSEWKNGRLRSGLLKNQEEYWLERLSGELPVLNLPYDFPRPSTGNLEGERIRFYLEEQLTGKLKEFTGRTGTTLFMVLLAVYNILLSKYSGQTDIIIGSPSAGRTHVDLENTIGLVIDTIVSRSFPEGEKTFEIFLEEIKETTIEANENQDYPFRELVKQVVKENDLTGNPLFAVMLNVLDQNMDGWEINGLKIIPYTFDYKVSWVDLTLEAVETRTGIMMEIEYCTKLFKRITVEMLARQFTAILDQVLACPSITLAEIGMFHQNQDYLWDDERDINGGKEDRLLHELVEDAVEKYADHTAVVHHDRQFTYAEVNRRANRLARVLRAAGVKPGHITAIMLEPSIEMIIGILGILKAGGCYLPIDPEYPQKRVLFMLKDSNANALVTTSTLAKEGEKLRSLEVMRGRETIFIDTIDFSNLSSSQLLNFSTSPSFLAYIIYTSGSTGTPKGVMAAHRNAAAYLKAFAKIIGLTPGNVVLQQASFSFDTYIEEVFPILAKGGRIALPDKYETLDIPLLSRFISRYDVDIIDCSPLLLNELNQLSKKGALQKQGCTFISGGDVLKKGYVDNLPAFGKVYNSYGPTETTVCATYYEYSCNHKGKESIPIGKPIPGYHVYILDKRVGFLPVGPAGELCISGTGVTRGYLNRPELTKEKFYLRRPGGRFLKKLPPWTPRKNFSLEQAPGKRDCHMSYGAYMSYIYRTGDLARWLPDGNIQFLGRIDQQVKVRGYRIEPEEIEKKLLKYHGIQNTAAVIIEKQTQGKYICAYFESDNEKNLRELRDFLSQELPDYMIPAQFVRLEKLPVTPNGKIDRKKLAETPGEHIAPMASTEKYTPPRNETEKKMAEIWQGIFQRDKIGIDDHFFELGGDSLLAIRCITSMREEMQLEISLRNFFDQPYIRALARGYETRSLASGIEEIPGIPKAPGNKPIPLSFSQERLWFLQKLDKDNMAYFVPRAIRIIGQLDVNLMERTFTDLIKRHEILRTVFPETDGKPEQRILHPAAFKIPVIDLTDIKEKARPEEVSRWIREEGQREFDLENGPLLRVTLLKLKQDEHMVVLTEHHLIHDGWTQGVLLREFIVVFTAYLEGKPSPLPELPIQYADFACWQRDYLRGETLERHLDYWRKKLSGLAPVLELPADRPRPLKNSGKGSMKELVIPAPLTAALKKFSKKQGVTLFMTMLTVFKIFLYRYTGVEDLCVGTGAANRRIKELEGMLGMAINTLALKTQIRAGLTFKECLQRVKQTCVEAFEHEDTPFDRVVDAVRPERSLSYNPIFQVFFTFMDIPTQDLALPGLELAIEESHNRSAKFDVNIVVVPPQEQHTQEEHREILIEWEYNTDIFDDSTIDKMLIHYNRLLEETIHHPEDRISDISFLSEIEKKQLLYDFNETKAEYPSDRKIHELFEEQAARVPDNIAAAAPQQRNDRTYMTYMTYISYRKLNQKSDQLAHSLKKKGVNPDTIVGIMIERSIEMIVGILGILKAGSGYLPIDPAYPKERIDYMMADSGAKVLLTNREEVENWRDSPLERGGREAAGVCQNSYLAYVIYTSGSTGKPKGVIVEHPSVVNILWALQKDYPLREPDTYLLKTSYVFDVSVTELFGWFLEGGQLAVLEEHGEKDPGKILNTLERENVTHINFVPSMFNVFVDELNSRNINKLSSLKYIFLAGEVLLPELFNKFRRPDTHILLENIYGPTEGTVYSSRYSLSGWQGKGSIPIGKPMQNTRIYILDRCDGLQPIGVPGELCIGGVGLARGYLNNPELTAEQFLFVSNKSYRPYKSYISKKIYKTGDLARWLQDGNIEFLGRIDHQVKIRGFRIELEEIENCLLNHEDIKEAAAIVNQGRKKENYLCAYIVSTKELTLLALRDYLSKKLPIYMVPAHFFQVKEIPLTPGGKVNRQALLSSGTIMGTGMEYVSPTSDIERTIVGIWQELLEVDRVSIHDNFFDMGGNSFSLVRLNHRIKEVLKIDIPIVTLFNYPTIASLARYISQGGSPAGAEQPVEKEKNRKPLKGLEIAVIGMACRFPGAKNIREFWDNLKNGVESIAFRFEEELKEIALDPGIVDNPNYIPAKAILENKDYFDAWFFGYTPAEAEIMDPQIRIFHECCWEALENAGYDPETYAGTISLYAGATPNPCWEILPLKSAIANSDSFWESGMEKWEAVQFSGKDFLSTRIAYKLNLKGPCVTLQTACSTSLVAVDLASQALLSGKCDIAMTGGVSITFLDDGGYLYQEGAVTSVDGHCRAFDAHARGTIGGDGAGVVVLKRLEDAVPDNDTIYAVIKGFAINNDGKVKAGFTAPSVEGQARVIGEAQQRAGVKPESIGYVEAHGTGTLLGDPIEIEGLKQAFKTQGPGKKNHCAIGSVKTNIGHLDAAAGIAGLIKTVLAIKHRLIPPSLHFEQANPGFDLENSPFYVNNRCSPWKDNNYPLRAGVSSFGLGGTNAHVILEQAPVIGHSSLVIGEKRKQREYQLILLSAKTPSALDKMSRNLAEHFKRNPAAHLADAAYTLQVGRKAFHHRKMLVCPTNDAAAIVHALESGEVETGAAGEKRPTVVFMFSGQGSQFVNMGLDLYETEPVFRSQVDHCFKLLEDISGMAMKPVLYPGDTEIELEEAREKIHRFPYPQPIKFIFEYSLSILLTTWGIKPDAMVGYSLGEYAAACLSGVFSLEEALFIAFLRGKLIDGLPPGAMLGVSMPEEQLKSLLTGEISLAAVNSESMCVVSGPVEPIEAFEKELSEKGHECVRYRVSKAGHSWVMESILEEFKENIRGIKFKKPRIPFVSGVSGKWITAEEAMDPDYWTWHLRRTVRFADALTTLLQEPNRIFLEMSPGRGLTLFMNQHPDKKSFHQAFNLVRHQKEEVSDVYYTLTRIGRLWLQGVPIDNRGFYLDRMPRRIPLPTYPFERDYYKPPKNILKSAVGEVGEKTGLKKNPNIDNWFYIPSWERRPLIKSFCGGSRGAVFSKRVPLAAGGKKSTLVFIDNSLGAQLVKRWEQEGHGVIIVTKGASFKIVNESSFIINPGNPQDYDTLVKHLHSQLKDKFPRQVIHLWGVEDPDADGVEEIDIVDSHLSTGFYSLIYLAKAVGSLDISGDIQIDVVTCGVHEVTGQERLYPGKAAVLGPLKVIPQEYPHINCRNIDIAWPQTGRLKEKLPDQLLSEISARSEDLIAAYRNDYRWVQSVAPIRLPGPGENEKTLFLRQKGVYLLTGGLGRVGLILARHLARSVRAKLILTGYSAFPSKRQWEQWLPSHPADDGISRKIKKLKEIEETGAEVLVFRADVSDRVQMKNVLEQAEEKFGPINGVMHCAAKVGQDMYRAIKEINDHDCKEQFKPKIYGLLVLEQLLGDRELDFCLLMSSGSSFLGGLGFAAYSAANNFMDAFVYYYKRSHPFRWLSINWEVWQAGEAADKSSSPGMGAVGDSLAELALMPDEGAEVFDRVLAWPEALQAINSTGDLPARIRQWIKLESVSGQDQPGPGEKPLKKTRPALSTPYAAPTNSLEKELVNIWQELLGYEPIGIRDNFFELGGDSLKAVIVISKIHKALNIKISIKDFFSQPVIEALAGYINSVGKSSYFSVELVENKEYYPLSSVQKRLFVLNQREKHSTVYNIPSIMVLEGKLDREKPDETFRKLISRHESFRTAFILVEGEPVQRIHNEVNFEIEYYLATDDRSGTPLSSVIRRLSSEFVRPFDLSRAPLLRVGLIHLHSPPLTGHPSQEGNAEDKYILMVDMHHSISDGTSMGILVKELMALYQGESLPPLKLQYKDFSQWQRNETGHEGFQQQKEYWLKQLQGEIPVLNLPLDFPRPVVQSFEGRHVELEPEVRETTALKELAGKEGTTLYMALLSIYGILLARLGGQEDILIGAPIAGRRHADSHHVIGMFVNTLVLRINPGREKKYRDFLRQVKEQTLAAFENQDYPFEDLVEQLGAASDTGSSHNPLFDAAFIFQNIEIPEIRVPGLKLNRFPFEHEVSKFDMMLVTKEVKDTLCLTFEYNTQLFKHETMQRWAGYFRQVLLSILQDPDREITEIETLSPEEKQQILYDFNDTDADYPREKTIHELFEEQVEKVPDMIALHGCMNAWMHGGAYITYRELNESSNRLAYLLREKGIQPDTIVGILANRSIEMIVGILGILKPGGAYLPIDPGYPYEWINYVLADSRARILVSMVSEVSGKSEVRDGNDARWLKDLGKVGKVSEGTELILINKIMEYITTPTSQQTKPARYIHHIQHAQISLPTHLTHLTPPTQLCYIIYTSGTTGKPKGVMVGHGSVVNTLVCRKKEYKMNGDDTSLQLFPYVFDGFVTSLFTPIISGASVVLLSDEEITDIEKIKAAIVKNKVTHFICVPSLYSAIIESLTPGETSTLKVITLAGEKASLSLLENTIARNNNLEIVNEYGVTESAVMSTIYRHQEKDKTIKIGYPAWNTKIYILDRYNRVQPIGVPGELCIAGVGLARGYLNNPDLTAQKFCLRQPGGLFSRKPPPWTPRKSFLLKGSDSRIHMSYMSYKSYVLYKTGDLARWLKDGSIEFFGRMDHQVKIRGFRIEIGEIESRLSTHPEIKKTVVIDRDNGKGDKYLCAYIVGIGVSPGISPETLREYLSQTLPVFMIPSYFVALDNIPLTSSGKVDRKALPTPGISTGEKYLAPGNEIEERLVEIWSEVLNIEKEIIGVKDNFFDLGGNSLKVMQVNSKLKKVYEKDIPAAKMFKYPTIRSFADYLNANVNQESIQRETNRSRSDRSEARSKGKSKLKKLKAKIKEQSNA